MNLTRDFVQNGGIFMMIDTESGLSSADLNRIQTGMLTSNRIHRLLALRIKEVDNRITFHYDVTGLKMLSHIWFSHRHSIQVLYKLLYEILDTLDSSREYMLAPLQFVIHEDYIFVEGAGVEYTVRLAYLPLREGFATCSVGQSIKQLIIRLLGSIKELQGDGLQRLLQVCDQEIFDLQGMKLLLLEYLDDTCSNETSIDTASELALYLRSPSALDSGLSPANARSSPRAKGLDVQREGLISTDGEHLSDRDSVVASYLNKTALRKTADHTEGEGEYEQFLGRRERKGGEKASRMVDSQAALLHAPSFSDPPVWNYGEASADDEEMESNISTNGPRKYRVYIMSVCILLSAIVWRYLYLDHPGLTNLIIASAITVLLGIATLLAWFGKLRLNRDVEDYSEHVAELDSGELEDYEPVNSGKGATISRFQVERVTGYMSRQQRKGYLEGSEMEINRGKNIDRLGHGEEQLREGLSSADPYTAGDKNKATENQENNNFGNQTSNKVNYKINNQANNKSNSNIHNSIHRSIDNSVNNGLSNTSNDRRRSSVPDEEANSGDYYSFLKENTGALTNSASDATRFLGAEDRKIAEQRQEHDTQVACLYLLDTEGNHVSETIPIRLPRNSFTIGRGEESVYRISDAEGLSRLHVEISGTARGGEYRIKDLASTNGSQLNNEAMIPYKEYLLQHRDILKLPGVAFQYSSPLVTERPTDQNHEMAN